MLRVADQRGDISVDLRFQLCAARPSLLEQKAKLKAVGT
jgi:hypothetical protein